MFVFFCVFVLLLLFKFMNFCLSVCCRLFVNVSFATTRAFSFSFSVVVIFNCVNCVIVCFSVCVLFVLLLYYFVYLCVFVLLLMYVRCRMICFVIELYVCSIVSVFYGDDVYSVFSLCGVSVYRNVMNVLLVVFVDVVVVLCVGVMLWCVDE